MKLHDEIKFLTSGVAATGLEYVKHRKKKQLRGGIVPLVIMGLQTAVMEAASWAIEEDARREREKIEAEERRNEEMWKRQAASEQQTADTAAEKDYIEETARIQRNWGEEYKRELRLELEKAKREEEQQLDRQRLDRQAEDAQIAEEEKRMYEGNAQRQRVAATQRQLAIRQQESAATRRQQTAQMAHLQRQQRSLDDASAQRFDLELQQRLRSATAQQQAQAQSQQQRARRIIAPKSTEQKVRTRRR